MSTYYKYSGGHDFSCENANDCYMSYTKTRDVDGMTTTTTIGAATSDSEKADRCCSYFGVAKSESGTTDE